MTILADKILRETSPLSIFLVKSGSAGNRLLFRYPYDEQYELSGFQQEQQTKSTINNSTFNTTNSSNNEDHEHQFRVVISENDDALSNMFSVNPNLCGKKFEIKINNVRYVGHPMSLLAQHQHQNSLQSTMPGMTIQHRHHYHHHHHQPNNLTNSSSVTDSNNQHVNNNSSNHVDITSFNIVCALRASASYDIVNCYHDLSQRLAIALGFEERRCSYLTKEARDIVATLDEQQMAKLVDQDQQDQLGQCQLGKTTVTSLNTNSAIKDKQSIFSTILQRSLLAKDLKKVFEDLTIKGIVDLRINNWVRVSFCLPHKVHRLKLINHLDMPAIGPKEIQNCLNYLRPYHGLLLLQKPKDLLESLPIDASPAFVRLIKVTKPEKNFMDLSVDANLTLMQIFCIVSQLVYWAKATIIYPICDSNVYAIHPLASTGINSMLVEEFRRRFPCNKPLHHYLAEFSLGTSLSQLNRPLLEVEERLNLLNIVTWLLQCRILSQIHKYIFLVAGEDSSIHLRQETINNSPRKTNQQSSLIESNTISASTGTNLAFDIIYEQPTDVMGATGNSTLNSSSQLYINSSNNNNSSSNTNSNLSNTNSNLSNNSYSSPKMQPSSNVLNNSGGFLVKSTQLTSNNKIINNDITTQVIGETTNSTTTSTNGARAIPHANATSGSVGLSNSINNYEGSQYMVTRSPFSDSSEFVRRARTDSYAYSNEDSNFGLNSSLSSTPNSNIESTSPMNSELQSRSTMNNQPSIVASSGLLYESVLDQTIPELDMASLLRAGLTQTESKNILSVPASKNSEDLRLLIRLLPYFDGRHHIEDIMFFENLKRSQILILCDKFREVLFTCHYEDVAVDQLSPYNKLC